MARGDSTRFLGDCLMLDLKSRPAEELELTVGFEQGQVVERTD